MDFVLLIEGNEDLRENTVELLEIAGLETQPVANMTDAKSIMENGLPKIVVVNTHTISLHFMTIHHELQQFQNGVRFPVVALCENSKSIPKGVFDFVMDLPYNDADFYSVISEVKRTSSSA